MSGDRVREQRPERSWWGLWRRLDLIGPDGEPFLRRRGLDGQRLRLGGVLLHRIDAPDPGLDLHDHPWAFLSVVLRGGYIEEWAETRHACQRWATPQVRRWRRWSIHRMPLTVAHRITAVEPGTVTLVVRGRHRRRWGFYLPGGWIDWEEYPYDERRPVAVDSNRPEEVRRV